jgi:CTP:molybdopterin cytidylyltransferase MocA
MSTAPSAAVPVAGIVLAAGAGSRFGRPKALAGSRDGSSWLVNAVRSLLGGGCSPVVVVLGAAADEAEAVLKNSFGEADSVRAVRADDWQSGMAASLRRALTAARDIEPQLGAIAIVTVDVPSLGPARRPSRMPWARTPCAKPCSRVVPGIRWSSAAPTGRRWPTA